MGVNRHGPRRQWGSGHVRDLRAGWGSATGDGGILPTRAHGNSPASQDEGGKLNMRLPSPRGGGGHPRGIVYGPHRRWKDIHLRRGKRHQGTDRGRRLRGAARGGMSLGPPKRRTLCQYATKAFFQLLCRYSSKFAIFASLTLPATGREGKL